MSIQEYSEVQVQHDDVGARMGMWLFLFTELLLFGGMFFLYSVYRFMNQEQFHIAAKELNTLIGTFNTIILLTSSLTIALSVEAIRRNNKRLSIFLQVITILLALGFLVNKYFEWSVKFQHGLFPGSEILTSKPKGEILFFGLYYVMTGLHSIHVVIGIFLISFMTRLTVKNVITQKSYVKLETAGLYWHLVDIIWIFLFPLFYLIT